MKLNLFTQPLEKLRTDLVVVVHDEELKLFDVRGVEWKKIVDRAKKGFRGETLKKELYHTLADGSPVKSVLVFSTKLSKSYNVWESVKIFAARALEYARSYGLTRIAFLLNTADGAPFVGKVVEGCLLGDYRFDRYRKKPEERSPLSISLVTRDEDRAVSRARMDRYEVVSTEVNQCRDVVNEPGGAIYPETLARLARKVASSGKLRCTILNEKQLAQQGYNGLIQVGKGSVHPPRMIVLAYTPAKRSRRHLALVGKGITFDTGGISLKPPEGMWMMKGDMAGGAAVIYAMAAIARLKPPVRVTGIVASAENFPGNRAQRPGDIFIAKNGKSVMVDNTDAEGRLVLTDALARAGEEKATHIVDIATLTGSCVRALGNSVAGIMGNNADLVRAVIACGRNHGEEYWELPLVEEYRDMLKTPYADVNNVGGKLAGAITAGLFLREFVPEDTAWAHLDIAGPFLLEKKWKYYTEGATGFGVKTMADLAERFETLFP